MCLCGDAVVAKACRFQEAMHRCRGYGAAGVSGTVGASFRCCTPAARWTGAGISRQPGPEVCQASNPLEGSVVTVRRVWHSNRHTGLQVGSCKNTICHRRDNIAELEENCRRRNSNADPQLVAQLYTEYVAMEQKVDGVRKERNDNAASMKVREEGTGTWAGAGALADNLAFTLVTGAQCTSAPVLCNAQHTFSMSATSRSVQHPLRCDARRRARWTQISGRRWCSRARR